MWSVTVTAFQSSGSPSISPSRFMTRSLSSSPSRGRDRDRDRSRNRDPLHLHRPAISKTTTSLQLSPTQNSECPVNGEIGIAAIAGNIVVAYSLYVLKTTGCGLPPG